MGRPQATEEQYRRTRTALLDTAQSLYETEGFPGMSFRAIAAAYGCSYSMPYSYFDSKADIVDALRVRAYDWIHDTITDAAAKAASPIDAVRAVAEAYVRAGLERPRTYELLYTTEGAADETNSDLVTAKVAALGACASVIESAADSGSIELATDPLTAAHLFWIAAHGLVSLQLGGFLVVGRSIDDVLPTLFATMVRGTTGGQQA